MSTYKINEGQSQKLPKRLYRRKQPKRPKKFLAKIPNFAQAGLDKRAGQRNYHMARSGAYADPRKQIPIDISKRLLVELVELSKARGMGTMLHNGLSLHSLVHIAIKRKLGIINMPAERMVARYPYYKDVSGGRWEKPPYPEIYWYMKNRSERYKRARRSELRSRAIAKLEKMSK